MTQSIRELLRTLGNWVRLSDIALNGHPNYYAGYNGWHAMLSDGYIRQYYDRQAAESPLLRTLQPDIILRLTINDLNRIRRERRTDIILLLALTGYLFLIFAMNVDFYVVMTVGVILLGLEQFLLRRLNHSHYAESAADRLFIATLKIERNSKFWNDTDCRWRYAAVLERVARDLERIPYEIKHIAPSARRDLLSISRAKAQAMRDLEVRTINPKEFTDNDMTKRLMQDMCTILEGRWYELPEESYEQQVSKWSLALQLTGAFILIGGAITLVGLAAKLGPLASILATLLIAIALYFLNTAGIPTGVMERYAKIGNEMTSGK